VLSLSVEGHALAGECGKGPTDRRVISLLRAGGFTGWLKGDSREALGVLDELRITKIGSVKSGHDCPYLYLYLIRHHAPHSLAHHETDRLLVMTDSKYLGSYTITEFPTRLKGNVLEFPRDKDFPNEDLGYTITFGPDGPPAQVHLLGEVQGFGK
jgi:hypothetical protein